MKTKKEIDYCPMPYGHVAMIPKGTPVTHAYTLPDDNLYWAESWENMTEIEKSWERNYGFLIEESDVE